MWGGREAEGGLMPPQGQVVLGLGMRATILGHQPGQLESDLGRNGREGPRSNRGELSL